MVDKKNESINEYDGAKIVNIRRGAGRRDEFVYAQLVSSTGELLVSASLDDIVEIMRTRLPKRNEP